MPTVDSEGMPGADLLTRGLEDLPAGRESIESLLVDRIRAAVRALGRAAIDPKSFADAVAAIGDAPEA